MVVNRTARARSSAAKKLLVACSRPARSGRWREEAGGIVSSRPRTCCTSGRPGDLDPRHRRFRHGAPARARPGGLRPPSPRSTGVFEDIDAFMERAQKRSSTRKSFVSMAGKYASMFLVSRFQSELERLFQEALAVGESSRPGPSGSRPSTSSRRLGDPRPRRGAGDERRRPDGRGQGTLVTLTGTKSTPLPTARRIKFQCVERGHGGSCARCSLLAGQQPRRHGALQDGLLTIEFPSPGEAAGGSPFADRGNPGDHGALGSGRMTSRQETRPTTRSRSLTSSPCSRSRTTVIFPYIILPLSVGRDKSVLGGRPRARREPRHHARGAARRGDRQPRRGGSLSAGHRAVIMRMLKLPDGRIRIRSRGWRAPKSSTSARWTPISRRRSSASRSRRSASAAWRSKP